MIYNIQQRIFTLVDNAVIENERMAAAFSIDTMRFSHWDFDIHNGWVSDLWLAEDSVEGAGLIDAIGRFRKALARVTPRISFIGQSYIEFVTEPYLWFIKSKDGTPLVLKEVLADFQKNGIDRHDHFEYDWDTSVETY